MAADEDNRPARRERGRHLWRSGGGAQRHRPLRPRSDLAHQVGDDLRRVQKMFPAYAGPRTLSTGHVFRPGLSGRWALGLMFLFERLKFIVRARKKFLRAWRYWRARMEIDGDHRRQVGAVPHRASLANSSK